jgi:hypothetical protein
MNSYFVRYKTDTNKHHPGDPLAYDTRERVVVSTSPDSAVDYVLRTNTDAKLVPGTCVATFYRKYSPS